MKFPTGRYKQVIGMLKIVVDGVLKTQTTSSTKLRRKNMIKKLWKIVCWPWTKFINGLAKELPEK